MAATSHPPGRPADHHHLGDQVEVEVLAFGADTLLAGYESEAFPQLKEEALQLIDQGLFKVGDQVVREFEIELASAPAQLGRDEVRSRAGSVPARHRRRQGRYRAHRRHQLPPGHLAAHAGQQFARLHERQQIGEQTHLAFTAASTRSSSISTSALSTTVGSMRMERIFPRPSAVTVTMPPPLEEVTVRWPSSD